MWNMTVSQPSTPRHWKVRITTQLLSCKSPTIGTILYQVSIFSKESVFWIPSLFYFNDPSVINHGFFETFAPTVVLAKKIDEIDKSISSIQASKSDKRDIRHFSGAKVCYSNRNVKFENFMHNEWREEKFLKGIVCDKMRLRFWNKHQMMQLVLMQLARYNWMHIRVLRHLGSLRAANWLNKHSQIKKKSINTHNTRKFGE